MDGTATLAALMLGGNQGDTVSVFRQAVDLLNEYAGEVTRISEIYRSDPWGMHEQPPFLNQALLLKTTLTARQLLEQTQRIERELGRVTGVPNGPRRIDIDLLLLGNQVVRENGIEVPHPRMHLRRFNLEPLSAIAGEWIHPVYGQSIRELNGLCNDPLSVIKVSAHETGPQHPLSGY